MTMKLEMMTAGMMVAAETIESRTENVYCAVTSSGISHYCQGLSVNVDTQNVVLILSSMLDLENLKRKHCVTSAQ